MAYEANRLEQLCGGQNKIHQYDGATTGDGACTKAQAVAAGYFNLATNNLRKGDTIIVNASDGTSILTVTSATHAAAVTTAAVAATA